MIHLSRPTEASSRRMIHLSRPTEASSPPTEASSRCVIHLSRPTDASSRRMIHLSRPSEVSSPPTEASSRCVIHLSRPTDASSRRRMRLPRRADRFSRPRGGSSRDRKRGAQVFRSFVLVTVLGRRTTPGDEPGRWTAARVPQMIASNYADQEGRSRSARFASPRIAGEDPWRRRLRTFRRDRPGTARRRRTGAERRARRRARPARRCSGGRPSSPRST